MEVVSERLQAVLRMQSGSDRFGGSIDDAGGWGGGSGGEHVSLSNVITTSLHLITAM